MVKTFKVSIRATEEVSANNMDEAVKIASKMILRGIGFENVTDENLALMDNKFVCSITGKKD